jgi:serine/threonine protein kinase
MQRDISLEQLELFKYSDDITYDINNTNTNKNRTKNESNTNNNCNGEELIVIPYGYNHLIDGGYASIYYNSNINSVLKIQPLYNTIKLYTYLCTSTLYESIIQHALINIPNVSSLDKYEISNNTYIAHYMPYYGITLHKYMKEYFENNLIINIKEALSILLSITKVAIELYKKGMQHTDIKPTNILISNTKTITIIDYNICSVKSSGNTKYGWSYGIGTWCYCSPEIINYEEPSDTSIVWTIGLLIVFLYCGHPLSSKYKNIHDYKKQSEWKAIFEDLKRNHSNGLPLSKNQIKHIPKGLYNIYTQCTYWNWRKRISLDQLYNLLLKELSPQLPSSSLSSIFGLNMIDSVTSKPDYESDYIIPYKIEKEREAAFVNIWKICKYTKRYDLLTRSLILFDKYPKYHTSHSIFGCVLIAYIISGSLLSEQNFYNTALNILHVPIEDMNNAILKTLVDFDWRCYYETADTLIIDYILEYGITHKNTEIQLCSLSKQELIVILYSRREFYIILYEVLQSRKSIYKMITIIQLVFKELQLKQDIFIK